MSINYTYKENGSWSTPELIANSTVPVEKIPPICILKYGTLHLGYVASDGSQNNAYYTSAEFLTPAQTPVPAELPYTGK